MSKFEGIKGIVSDLDGVWFQGNKMEDGGPEFMEETKRRGWKMTFASNGAGSCDAVVNKFAKEGIEIAVDDVLTAGHATGVHLYNELQVLKKKMRVLFLGPPELEEVCAAFGLKNFLKQADVWDANEKRWIGEKGRDPSHVVVSRHNYDQGTVEAATAALRRGGKWIATGMDHAVTTETGDYRAGTGTLVAAIQRMLATVGGDWKPSPEIQGKPNPTFIQASLDRMQLTSQQTAMLGDSLETDMEVARKLGMKRWLVLSGVTKTLSHSMHSSEFDHAFTNIAALTEALRFS